MAAEKDNLNDLLEVLFTDFLNKYTPCSPTDQQATFLDTDEIILMYQGIIDLFSHKQTLSIWLNSNGFSVVNNGGIYKWVVKKI